MKKFIILMLSAALCLAAMALLTGCGGTTDTSDLEARLAAVEQENKDLQKQLDALKGEPTTKIYKLGETATVFANEMPMFSIKYVTRYTSGTSALFTFTNINLPNCILDATIVGRLHSTTSSSSTSVTTQPHAINKTSKDITVAQFGGAYVESYNQIYFCSPTSALTYAIFEL